MNATDEFGPELRRRRTALGVSLRDLAAEVHCDPGFLSRVERGHRQPSPIIARLCDRALRADGALVALLDHVRPTGPTEDLALGPARPVSYLVRSFQRASAGATVLTGDHESTAAGAYALFAVLRAQGHGTAPSALLPALAVQFGTLQAAAVRARGRSRAQLALLAAHYAEYAGWMIQECGDRAGALALTEVAARLSARAPDGSLASYLQLRRADIALYNGDGAAVVALAEQVERGPASLRVRAVAAQRAAQGWALLGHTSQCVSALARAADATEVADAETVPASDGITLGSVGGGRLMDVVRGWCYLDLGRPEQAVEALRCGLARAPRTARRARALYGVRLALAHAAAGDSRQAREVGTVALAEARPVESASVRHQLRALATVVRRWPGGVAIRDFQMLIDRELKPSRILS